MSFFIAKFLQLKQMTKDQQDPRIQNNQKFNAFKQYNTFVKNKENFTTCSVYGQKFDLLKTYTTAITSAKE